MLFSKFAGFFLLCFSIIAVACPISERADGDELEVYIALTTTGLVTNIPTFIASLPLLEW